MTTSDVLDKTLSRQFFTLSTNALSLSYRVYRLCNRQFNCKCFVSLNASFFVCPERIIQRQVRSRGYHTIQLNRIKQQKLMLPSTFNERYVDSKLSNITSINIIYYHVLLCIISTNVYSEVIVSILKILIHDRSEFVDPFYLQNTIPSESINTIMCKSLEFNVNGHKLRAFAEKRAQLREILSIHILGAFDIKIILFEFWSKLAVADENIHIHRDMIQSVVSFLFARIEGKYKMDSSVACCGCSLCLVVTMYIVCNMKTRDST